MNLDTLHLLCAAYMTGVIWFVQLVQYPMLHHADGPDSAAGHLEYTRRMGYVVAPVMISELLLQLRALWLVPGPLHLSTTALLVLIWISTFLLQVPLHQKLTRAYTPDLHRRLVRSNWLRTFAWTTRALLLATIVPVAI